MWSRRFLLVLSVCLIFANLAKSNSSSSSSESSEEGLIDQKTEFTFSSLESENDDSDTENEDSGSVNRVSYIDEDFADHENEHENIEFFQGDIILTKKQKESWLKGGDGDDSGEYSTNRTGILDEEFHWTKNDEGFVIIPFEISKLSKYKRRHLKLIRTGMKIIEKHTCVRFHKHEDEANYIYIGSGKGCDSHIGMIGGQQKISLNRDSCMSRGTVLHELMHAIGFDHMQNHPERDNHIKIHWDNIPEEWISQFDKVNATRFSHFGTPYDFYSVMHYEKNAFAIDDSRPTMSAKNPKYDDIIGQRSSISRGDITRMNRLYKCKNVKWN